MTKIPRRAEKIELARQLRPVDVAQLEQGDHREAGRLVQGQPYQGPSGACTAANSRHEDEQPGAVLRPVPEVMEAGKQVYRRLTGKEFDAYNPLSKRDAFILIFRLA